MDQSSVISYQLPENSMVSLKVYDITGRELGTLENGVKAKGKYSLNYVAEGLRSGVYLVRMLTNNGAEVLKFVKE